MAIAEHAIVSGSYSTQSITGSTDKRDVSDMLDLWAHKWTPVLNRMSWGPESGGLLGFEWIVSDFLSCQKVKPYSFQLVCNFWINFNSRRLGCPIYFC